MQRTVTHLRADVYDCAGGGDGYASGLRPDECKRLKTLSAWAHSARPLPGDTTMATVEQVRAFAKGGAGPDPKASMQEIPKWNPASFSPTHKCSA
jgi:hypothetical protein